MQGAIQVLCFTFTPWRVSPGAVHPLPPSDATKSVGHKNGWDCVLPTLCK